VPELQFAAIGTSWTITTPTALGFVERAVHDRIDAFDRTWSRFRDDSLVTRLSIGTDSVTFPDDAVPLFELYDTLFVSTAAAVTPLIGRALEHLGYDRDYRLTVGATAEPAPDWRTSVQRSGSTVSVSHPVLIDVGAAGKGYLVDLVGELLRENGIHEFVIDASGDLLVSTPGVQRIALEHPLDPTLAIGIAELSCGAICASASNRRAWGAGLHHILDGRTGLPTPDVVATWAVAATALVADGLATALFFTPPARLAEDFDFEYVTILASGITTRSRSFPGEVFS